MEIKEIMTEIYQNNEQKGFWENKDSKNIGELLMLCVSELAEALEAHRTNHKADILKFNQEIQDDTIVNSPEKYKVQFEKHIKNSFEDEIADTVIRLFDLSEGLGIDLEKHIRLKIEYNKLRPFKHGKAY